MRAALVALAVVATATPTACTTGDRSPTGIHGRLVAAFGVVGPGSDGSPVPVSGTVKLTNLSSRRVTLVHVGPEGAYSVALPEGRYLVCGSWGGGKFACRTDAQVVRVAESHETIADVLCHAD